MKSLNFVLTVMLLAGFSMSSYSQTMTIAR
jgi:hypothetical protein